MNHVHSKNCSHGSGDKNLSLNEGYFMFFFKKRFCINNQINKFYANVASIMILFSGAYLDINYYSYSIENEFDRKYESILMLILFLTATFLYLRCSHMNFSQTKIEEKENSNLEIVNIDYNKYNKNCEFCKLKKFERSSHCTTCGVCVLRRDHHCPALGSCVGYNNLQYFTNLCFVMIVSIIKKDMFNDILV